ncbi:MAG TPA: c-type cytochrome biogenesis protein CcmI, partial [Pseudomonadales bacterium]
MTGFMLMAGLSLLVAAAFIAWPLLRRPGGTAEQNVGTDGERGDVNVQLYRSRVAEIERERDSGALDAAEAESLLHE